MVPPGVPPNPLKPLYVMVGRPQPSGASFATPGMLSSLSASRTKANSPTPLLLKRLIPNRKSFTRFGDSVRVLEISACQGSLTVLPPFRYKPGCRLNSLPQLNRPNQLDLALSTKSTR